MIKRPFTKIFWFFASPIRKVYWFIFRPKTRGVKCMIQWQDKILFVRISYAHKGWTVPGGGVNKNESFEEAVCREVKEEVGITLGEVRMFREYVTTKEYKIDTVQCFWSKVENSDFKIDDNEIVEAKWSRLDDIPEPHRPGLVEVLSFLKLE
jgi:ADP-ribose pyrophosphatase YjhB (NUDIX family)